MHRVLTGLNGAVLRARSNHVTPSSRKNNMRRTWGRGTLVRRNQSPEPCESRVGVGSRPTLYHMQTLLKCAGGTGCLPNGIRSCSRATTATLATSVD